ncbi:MAG: hypothetical protein ACRCY9_10685, partial [Phycicoccus sp.]
DGAPQSLRRSLGGHHVVPTELLHDGWRCMVGSHYVHDVLGARCLAPVPVSDVVAAEGAELPRAVSR